MLTPRVGKIFDIVGGSNLFTEIDLKNELHQLGITTKPT